MYGEPDTALTLVVSSSRPAEAGVQAATGRAPASFDVLVDGVNTAHLSHDGRRVVTADRAGRVRVWSVADDARAPAEIVAWARCHLPFRVASARLELAAPDRSACAG